MRLLKALGIAVVASTCLALFFIAIVTLDRWLNPDPKTGIIICGAILFVAITIGAYKSQSKQ